MKWHRASKSFLMEDTNLSILYFKCYGCWWPGNTKSQEISSHSDNLICTEYSVAHTKGVHALCSLTPFDLLIFNHFDGLVQKRHPHQPMCTFFLNPFTFLQTVITSNIEKIIYGIQIYIDSFEAADGPVSLSTRDQFVNAPSQWEMTLHSNVLSHRLAGYTKWSLT